MVTIGLTHTSGQTPGERRQICALEGEVDAQGNIKASGAEYARQAALRLEELAVCVHLQHATTDAASIAGFRHHRAAMVELQSKAQAAAQQIFSTADHRDYLDPLLLTLKFLDDRDVCSLQAPPSHNAGLVDCLAALAKQPPGVCRDLLQNVVRRINRRTLSVYAAREYALEQLQQHRRGDHQEEEPLDQLMAVDSTLFEPYLAFREVTLHLQEFCEAVLPVEPWRLWRRLWRRLARPLGGPLGRPLQVAVRRFLLLYRPLEALAGEPKHELLPAVQRAWRRLCALDATVARLLATHPHLQALNFGNVTARRTGIDMRDGRAWCGYLATPQGSAFLQRLTHDTLQLRDLLLRHMPPRYGPDSDPAQRPLPEVPTCGEALVPPNARPPSPPDRVAAAPPAFDAQAFEANLRILFPGPAR